MLVVFDTVVRYLRARGYAVTYVRNITDIDDKIIRRAEENREDIQSLTKRFIRAMHEDAEALGVLAPTMDTRATENIDAIVAMVQTLLDKGFAYKAENGDIYYAVHRFHPYGALANKKVEDLRVGARIEVAQAKHDPLDFVLWKAAKPEEPCWPSPWGPGRPGWHIECSAMSTRCIGDHFDIHGGGMDLKFPHHENEIAQSEAASGHPFVNYWMHNGFVQINDEKMAKSLGNFFTVREVLARYRPEVVRFFILTSHYRSPLNYSDDNLENAKSSLTRLYTALRDLPAADTPLDDGWRDRFNQAMDDDFNTPEALAALFDMAREINRLRDGNPREAARLGAGLRRLGDILGLLQSEPACFLQGNNQPEQALTSARIETLIARRTAARANKNWAEADRIRALLAAESILLEDNPEGTTWRRA